MAVNNTVRYDILKNISSLMRSNGIRTYVLNRPKTTPDSMEKFIVVDMPVRYRNVAKGYNDFNKKTSGILYLFCKAKTDGTPNIDMQTLFERDVLAMFPMVFDKFSCSNASPLTDGLDEYGFHVTTITFEIKIKSTDY